MRKQFTLQRFYLNAKTTTPFRTGSVITVTVYRIFVKLIYFFFQFFLFVNFTCFSQQTKLTTRQLLSACLSHRILFCSRRVRCSAACAAAFLHSARKYGSGVWRRCQPHVCGRRVSDADRQVAARSGGADAGEQRADR